MSNIKNNQKFISDLSGKFLFMRHGQSIFNKVEDESRKINPELCDAHLSEEGINQVISKQNSQNQEPKEDIYPVKQENMYHKLKEMKSLTVLEEEIALCDKIISFKK